MLLKVPRMNSCWCGVSLGSGTKFIGYFSLVCNFLGGLCRIWEWTYVKPHFDFGTFQDFTCVATAIVSLALVFCSGLLLFGAYKSLRMFLIPWLLFDMLLRCIHIVGFAYCVKFAVYFSALAYDSWKVVSIFFAVCIAIGIILGTYLWWVVLSHFLELYAKETLAAKQKNSRINSSELAVFDGV